jgi:biopolymer transport protein ExbD
MAEVQHNTASKGSGSRQRKRSTRIDMTAMVDVAFLLLTFFILTTTLAAPRALEVIKPTDEASAPVQCSKVLEIFPGQDGQVHWYAGCDRTTVSTTDFSEQGIRRIIREHLAAQPMLVITVKPTPASKFANMVDILDEMKITGAPRYALAPLATEDIEMLSLKDLK